MLELFDGPTGVEETMRFIEEQGGAGLWRYDIRTGALQWSNGFWHLVGIEPGVEQPSLGLLDSLTHPDDVLLAGELEALIQRGGTLRREYRIIQRNGRVRWLSSRGETLLDRDGRPSRMIGVSFDVTQQHEYRVQRDAFQGRLESLVVALGGSVWTASPDGKALDVLGWCALTGQSRSDAAGCGWLAAVHPEDRAPTMEQWNRAVTEGTDLQMEYRVRIPNGEYRWVRSRAAPVMKDNKIIEWVGLLLDIQGEKVWAAPKDSGQIITGAQLRAARGLVNWSVKELADFAGVSPATIRRLEESNTAPRTAEPALDSIRGVLEQHGVDFLFPPAGTPCVGLKSMSKH